MLTSMVVNTGSTSRNLNKNKYKIVANLYPEYQRRSLSDIHRMLRSILAGTGSIPGSRPQSVPGHPGM